MPPTIPDLERRWKNLPGEPVGDAGDPYTGYDRFGRTERMRWFKNPLGGTLEHLVDAQWGYNRASLKTWRKDLLAPASAGQDQHFGYDGLYQLTERQRGLLNINTTAAGGIPAQVENFSYDETGNWVSYRQSDSGELDIDESRVNNRSNQMTQVDGSSAGVSYDKNGNMLTVPTGEGLTGPSRKLVWDAWNRLRKVSDASDEVIAAYEYDGKARRTQTQSDGLTRHCYYNDQRRSVEERLDSETFAEKQYVWHPADRWEMLFREHYGKRCFPLKDQLDTVALCDKFGILTERFEYRAFGDVTFLLADYTPNGDRVSGAEWNFLFHGEFMDDETGWYNYGYRYYVPTLGRWISRDPIGEEGGMNLYAMVGNNPIGNYDVEGKLIVALIIAAAIVIGRGIWAYTCGEYATDKCTEASLTLKGGDRFKHCCVSCVTNRCLGLTLFETLLGGFVHEVVQAIVAGNTWDGAIADLRSNLKGLAYSYVPWRSCVDSCKCERGYNP